MPWAFTSPALNDLFLFLIVLFVGSFSILAWLQTTVLQNRIKHLQGELAVLVLLLESQRKDFDAVSAAHASRRDDYILAQRAASAWKTEAESLRKDRDDLFLLIQSHERKQNPYPKENE